MAQSVQDLDILAAEPRRVRLKGQEYLLPGDVPIPTMVRLEQLSERGAEASQAAGDDPAQRGEANKKAMVELYEAVLGLFQVHQPDLEELPVEPTQLVLLINTVYGADDEAEPDPTPPPSGTTTKRRTPKKAAESPSSTS